MIKTINVTARDITEGTRDNCESCPIARAVLRHVKYAEVYRRKVYLTCTKCVFLPGIARDFISLFDVGKEVSPFKFKLDIPKEYLKNAS